MIKASYPFKSLIGCRETQFQLHKNTDYYLKHNISSLFCTKCLNIFFNERVNIDFYKGANRYNLVKFLLLEKKVFFFLSEELTTPSWEHNVYKYDAISICSSLIELGIFRSEITN